jgi:hypothetical protein
MYVITPILLLPVVMYIIESIISSENIKGDEKFGLITIISSIIPQILYIVFLFFIINLLKKIKLKRTKKLFFVFYFLFFIFYFLFFIFYFLFFIINDPNTIGEHYFFFLILPNMLYSIFELILLVVLLFIMYHQWKLYIYIIIGITCNIYMKYFISIDSENAIFFLIPFFFVVIQFLIEIYYFYQKAKPKWIRYNRMKKYQKNK